MNTLMSSDRKTLNLVVGAILVNSKRKLKKSEVEIAIVKRWIIGRPRGNSFKSKLLARKNCEEMNARTVISTN